MTHKPIEYSSHAAGQMRERRISRSDVKKILFTGTLNPELCNPAGKRYTKRLRLRDRDAEVMYIEDGNRYLIRSVWWVGGE